MLTRSVSKRRLSESVASCDSRFALVACFDHPSEYIEVDRSVLDQHECRLSALLRHSAPERDASGRAFYRAGAGVTRDVLVCFLRSLAMSQIIVSNTVTLAELMSFFDYEGVPMDKIQKHTPPVCSGLAFSRRALGANRDRLRLTCDLTAASVMSWNRLDLLASGGDSPDSYAVTSTRAWLRLCEKPGFTEDKNNFALCLVQKMHKWVSDGLVVLGLTHARLCNSGAVNKQIRDQTSFNLLAEAMAAHTLGDFAFFSTDVWKPDEATKRDSRHADKFCSWVKHTILFPPKEPELLRYAEACVTLIENAKERLPNLAHVFSGACCDDAGSTPERAELKKSFKKFGVSIMRWCETRDSAVRALPFPYAWREHGTTSGPWVLIDFEASLS